MYKFKLDCIKKSKLYQFLIDNSLNVDNCWKFTENVFQNSKLVKNIKKCWNILKNVEKCWMLGILIKMFKCWKMLIRKLNFLTQIIFFFDKEFKTIIIDPKFYQHLFSALIITNMKEVFN